MKKPKKKKRIDREAYFEAMDRTSVVLHHGLEAIRASLENIEKREKHPKVHKLLENAEDALADVYSYFGNLWAKRLDEEEPK